MIKRIDGNVAYKEHKELVERKAKEEAMRLKEQEYKEKQSIKRMSSHDG